MIDVALGIIAFGAVTTLAVEIALVVMLIRAGMRTKARLDRLAVLGRQTREHSAAIAANVARSVALAGRQADRAADIYAGIMEPLEPVLMAIGLARSLQGILRRPSRRR